MTSRARATGVNALFANESDDLLVYNVATALHKFPHEVEQMPAIDFINFRRFADKQALADYKISTYEKND